VSELPKGWNDAKIADVANLITKGTTPTSVGFAFQNSGIPFIKVENIKEGRISRSSIQQFISEDCHNYLSRSQLRSDDVLFSIAGTIGKTALVEKEDIPANMNQAISVVRVDPQCLVPRFLRYQLESLVTSELKARARGGAMNNVSLADVGQCMIVIPPLNEQKSIADKLDTLLKRVDACRERLDRVPLILKRFRQAVLAAATSGALTEDWREASGLEFNWDEVKLGDVADGFSYGSAAKSAKAGKIPVLRMGNIQNGVLDWSDLVFSSDPQEIKKYLLSAGDVLFNRTNSPELVGKTAIFKGERDAIYAGYLIRVRCGERLLPDYLNYNLNSPAGRDYCWQVKSDGVSQSNINAKKLAAFTFLLPSIKEQTEIVRRVEKLFAFADKLEARYTTARKQVEHLTPALLAKAFRGELVEQDPNDEPASVLLERIRAERAGHVVPKKGRGRKQKDTV